MILRNPGPWTFAIFACCCLLVGFLYWRGAPDAVKLAGALMAVALSAFGAKSALATPAKDEPEIETTVTKTVRPKLHTWPEGRLPEEPPPDTKRNGGE